jgi:hypothetical protein
VWKLERNNENNSIEKTKITKTEAVFLAKKYVLN